MHAHDTDAHDDADDTPFVPVDVIYRPLAADPTPTYFAPAELFDREPSLPTD